MKAIAAVITTMRAKGMSDSDILDVVAAMTSVEDGRSSGAARTARWRANKAAGVTSDVTVTSHKEMSPDPYKKTTPPSHPTDVQTPLGSQGEVKAKKRGTRLPRDWKPSAELESYAMEQGVPAECVEREFEDWCSWAWSDSSQKSVKLDWDLAAKTAMRRAADKYRARQRDPPRQFNRDPYRSPLD